MEAISINQSRFISIIINSSKQSADEYHKPCSIKQNRAGTGGCFFDLPGPNRQTGAGSNSESEFVKMSASLPARSSSAPYRCNGSSEYGEVLCFIPHCHDGQNGHQLLSIDETYTV